MKPEKKFWYEIKAFNFKNNCKLSFTRVENTASWGTPDILGYNLSGNFFTIELKVTKTNKVRLSPHQIAFHVKHPRNTFIIAQALGPRASKTFSVSMYRGSRIRELAEQGLGLEACCLGLEASIDYLLSI